MLHPFILKHTHGSEGDDRVVVHTSDAAKDLPPSPEHQEAEPQTSAERGGAGRVLLTAGCTLKKGPSSNYISCIRLSPY